MLFFYIICIKISLKFLYLCIIIVVIIGIIYWLLALIFRNYYGIFILFNREILFTLILVYDTQKIIQFENNNFNTTDDTDIIRLIIGMLKILGRLYGGGEPERNEKIWYLIVLYWEVFKK